MSATQEKNKEVEIKSYWWPEQTNIQLDEVKTGYNTLYLNYKTAAAVLAVPVACAFTYVKKDEIMEVLNSIIEMIIWLNAERSSYFVIYELSFFVAITTTIIWYLSKPKGIYLLEYQVWAGRPDWENSNEDFMRMTSGSGYFTKESIDFQFRMSQRTGVGERTYLPPAATESIHNMISEAAERSEDELNLTPPKITMLNARQEFVDVVFPIIDDVLAKTGIRPSQVGILVVNCSLFCPTPSLASMVINHYKMRSDIISFSLGGMGCSAGVIALDLAKDLLQVHKNTYALVVSTENITLNWYRGNERAMMLQNSLFRCGGAAVLLTNKWTESFRSKYQLQHVVRVHKGASDTAYHAVYQEEDKWMNMGVRLSKDLMNVAGEGLKTNMTVLGPLVLPWSEQIKFFVSFLNAKVYKLLGKKAPKTYVPDFKKAFQHFCIHAGGRAIIDGLEQNLKLTPKQVEPSRATLYRYGNTSSSSVWYELSYSEGMGYIKKGDTIWQIALGSGFKVNSAVWKALRTFPAVGTPPPEYKSE